ncbi:MAG: hypothetical protein AAFX01_14225 [Cyanobacteria bacterium J06638_28]
MGGILTATRTTAVLRSPNPNGKNASLDESLVAGLQALAKQICHGRFEELRSEVLINVDKGDRGELFNTSSAIDAVR